MVSDRSTQCVVLGVRFEGNDDCDLHEQEDRELDTSSYFTRGTEWFTRAIPTGDSDTQLRHAIRDMIQFSYRNKFEPILRDEESPSIVNLRATMMENPVNLVQNLILQPEYFTGDVGWGCMIRTGQDILANSLQRLKYGRQFQCYDHKDDEDKEPNDKEIIKWFFDSKEFPFSIQKFVETGTRLTNIKPGEWFGPSLTAQVIQKLAQQYHKCGIDQCIVSIDSANVYLDEINRIYEANPQSKILILLCVMLGLKSVPERYHSSIKHILACPQSVGIAGGKPSSSYYFIGFDENQLIYLDPHRVFKSCHTGDEIDYSTYHNDQYDTLAIGQMDPSMMIGFLLENKTQWDQWVEYMEDNDIINVLDTRMSVDSDPDIIEGID